MTNSASTRTPARRTLAAGGVLAVLAITGACGTSSDTSAESLSPAVEAPQRSIEGEDGSAFDSGGDAGALSEDFDAGLADLASTEEQAAAATTKQNPVAPADQAESDRKLISNGTVQLKSDDVAKAVFDVRKVVDTYSGEVTANSTQTDKEGEALRSRLVLRIPTAEFDNAMQDLERAAGDAGLIASSGNTEDVTTTVVDNEVRIKIQRQSIARIAVLLERATSIRDIVAIEAQLSQREADLEALLTQQRYLADQTAMSTIKVSVERTEEPKEKKEPTKDEDGFFAGLSAGWDALKTFGTGTAEVAGALLPWAALGGVLTVIGWPLVRRLGRRTTAAPGTPATATVEG